MIQKYSLPSRLLHWMMAFLFCAIFILVWSHEAVEDGKTLMLWHKSLGLIAFGLVFVRFFFRIIGSNPPELENKKIATLAKIGHASIYLLMIFVPLSMMVSAMFHAKGLAFFQYNFPPLFTPNKEISHALKEVHEFLATTLLFMIGGHIGFAFWHQFIQKDNIINRIR